MHFINRRETLVSEALDGMLHLDARSSLARLAGDGNHNVILDTSHMPDQNVSVISGGGSGHEPSHAGFVGQGMLAAAICGNIFASPSVDAVLAGIMGVTGDAGCLLIVKNYTGDRLNFGLAAEKARALGKKVEMVIVADDIALPDIRQPRGLAGTLFVHKIAGFFAATGHDLQQTAKMAREAAQSVVSLGISLGSCNIPGVGRESRIPLGEAELGLGIHGEPGAERIKFEDARQVSDRMLDLLFAKARRAASYALLLNNLGGTTPIEMAVIANSIFEGKHGGKIKSCIGPAPLMTALDMHGFSISLLPLGPMTTKALEYPVALPLWPGVKTPRRVAIRKIPTLSEKKKATPSSNEQAARIILATANALIESEARLNALDAKVGDGDTGTTVASAARIVKAQVGNLPLADLPATLEAIGDLLAKVMGGSSGVLLAIMFAAASSKARDGGSAVSSLRAGVERVQEYGGAALGDRTMIDALIPALTAVAEGQGFAVAAKMARVAADKTASMEHANAGRSTYISAENLRGNNDPGAEAVALVFHALQPTSDLSLSPGDGGTVIAD